MNKKLRETKIPTKNHNAHLKKVAGFKGKKYTWPNSYRQQQNHLKIRISFQNFNQNEKKINKDGLPWLLEILLIQEIYKIMILYKRLTLVQDFQQSKILKR